MTKEEIIKNLKYTMEKHKEDRVDTFATNIYVMCKDILEYLEQSNSDEDCISRKAVEDITWQDPSYSDALNALTEMREKIRALPSIQPKAKVRHWKEIREGVHTHWECSNCGSSQSGWGSFKYCPDCGTKMENARSLEEIEE